jgi:hypothetical protein
MEIGTLFGRGEPVEAAEKALDVPRFVRELSG